MLRLPKHYTITEYSPVLIWESSIASPWQVMSAVVVALITWNAKKRHRQYNSFFSVLVVCSVLGHGVLASEASSLSRGPQCRQKFKQCIPFLKFFTTVPSCRKMLFKACYHWISWNICFFLFPYWASSYQTQLYHSDVTNVLLNPCTKVLMNVINQPVVFAL